MYLIQEDDKETFHLSQALLSTGSADKAHD